MTTRLAQALLCALLAMFLAVAPVGSSPTLAQNDEPVALNADPDDEGEGEFESPLEIEGPDYEIELLIPDDAILIYDAHNAAVFTPDHFPMNAVYRQHSRAQAQVEVANLVEEEYEIADVEIQGEPSVAVHHLEIRGRDVYLTSDAELR